jgi:uncharacterized phage protein gp47/JayE
MDPSIDLSPTGPQGQLNGIMANAFSQLWEMLGVVYNSNNRQAAEGAGLDNIGDEVGIPRELATYTQVLCTLVFSSSSPSGSPYAPGALVANVAGNTALSFSNLNVLTVTSTTMNSVLMQAQTIGSTPTINPGALTVITNPVSGWLSITNPASQSQLGTNEELDPDYAARQEEELAAEGTCNASATVAALVALGAAQSPPINISATAAENTGNTPITYGALTLPPHTFAAIVYDPTGWVTSTGEQLIGNTIWNNKPAGISSIGEIAVGIVDEFLGDQEVYYTVPESQPLYLSATIVVRTGYSFSTIMGAVQTALISASTAATPPGGTPPNGQLLPGGDVVGSQLEAVIMAVPGVFDVQALTFAFSASPVNTAPLVVEPTSIATLTQADIANIIITQGTYP